MTIEATPSVDTRTPPLKTGSTGPTPQSDVLTEALERGSATAVMALVRSLNAWELSNALSGAGFFVDPGLVSQGRSAVYASVKRDLETALTYRCNGFNLKKTHAVANQNEPLLEPGHVIQKVMKASSVHVDILGPSSGIERASVQLIAGQGLNKGIQGFGFEGIDGKYQVPLTLEEVVDAHRIAARNIAVESLRTGVAKWAAQEKVNDLSELVPDSMQRLLHGSTSLQAAQIFINAIKNGSVAAHAEEIGLHSITDLLAKQGLDINAPTISEQASEIDLKIKDPDRNRGQYFGAVVALDHRAALVKFTRTEAIELPFSAMRTDQAKPRIGDAMHISFKNGVITASPAARQSQKTIGR